MKKYLVVLLVILNATTVWGFSRGSGLQTASGSISSVPCKIASVELHTDGTNDAEITLYDWVGEASGNGAIITTFKVTGSSNQNGRYWIPARKCDYGIYAVASGAGVSHLVDFF